MHSLCAVAQSEEKDSLNAQQSELKKETRYEVAKTAPDNEYDLERKAVDLRNPENLTTETIYDEKTHTYIVGNKIGESYLSVSSKGGSQLTEFEIDVVNYDENRHFFLAHYFRETYDRNMAQLPTIMSGVVITRMELWVTNKTSNYDNPRNVIAFTDLGEPSRISNPRWTATGERMPNNTANSLYYQMTNTYNAIRDIDQVGAVLGDMLSGSTDYEKVANARLLSQSEYTLNKSLGYVSLKSTLKSDEVLA